jgi:mono/diheme cytochrome c family protein
MKLPALPLAALAYFGLATSTNAQDAPTFYQDALPVFMNNCAACHQDSPPDVGGISAPMSLMDYE